MSATPDLAMLVQENDLLSASVTFSAGSVGGHFAAYVQWMVAGYRACEMAHGKMADEALNAALAQKRRVDLLSPAQQAGFVAQRKAELEGLAA